MPPSNKKARTATPPIDPKTIYLAWVILLVGSLLPVILLNQFKVAIPLWLNWIRLVLFVCLIIAGLFWKPLRPLRALSVVLFTLYAGAEVFDHISFNLPILQTWLGNSPFIQRLQPEQFNKLAISVLMIVALYLLGYRRDQMFLVRGNWRAPITPVRWLGFPKPDSWVWFGGQWSIYLSLGTGLALWLTSRPALSAIQNTLPLLPVILLMAAVNALNEEVVYRSAVLAALEGAVGKLPAWGMCAVFFGIAHFYGVPAGWAGIGLATFMGWMLSKAMLETRGFLWPWWIHFLQDAVIFFFIAAGSIAPAG